VCYAREDVDVFLRRILAGTEFPVGLFAPEDDYAEWILSQFLAQGVQVPRDIAVVGVGNQATANFRSSIPISSVQFPTTALGERAADMLLDAMSGRTSAKTTPILPLRVISRESTGAGSARDELVEQAMNLMHEYVGEASISEASLASLLGVGLVTLRSRCLEVLGRCPSDIWRNIRLQTAEDLLIGTELTVDAISRRCGYSGARAFIRAFKSATGQPPALWRKAARVPVA
jgi:AraC-like DNA-binding protein